MNNRKDGASLGWIYRVSGSGKKWILMLTFVRILQGLSTIVYAYTMRSVVDCATAGNSDAFFSHFLLFALLVLWTLILLAIGRYLDEKSRSILEKNFRQHFFSQLLKRDYAQVSRVHTGEWLNRITSDTQVVVNAVARILPELSGILVRMIGALITLLDIVPQIAYVIIPGGAIMILFSYVLRRRLKKYHKMAQEADGTVRAFIQERLTSLLVVHTFTQEQPSEEKSSELMDDLVAIRMKRHRFVNFCNVSMSGAVLAAQVLGIGLCSWGILQGAISYGTMSAVMYLINLLQNPFSSLSGFLPQYYSMLASAERLMEIETFPTDSDRPPVASEEVRQYYRERFQSVGLENACFAYEDDADNAVLQDLSMEIQKGEFVAFTGESGCGKSTTLKVLLSLYPLNSGHTYLRDTDGTAHPLDASWRGLFAYVPQGNQLISGTIRETLTFGDPALMKNEEAIRQALKVACADGFVAELPEGLDALLGERGSGLSEGQMQRLAIARAILSERPILLLDEATSALDAATETQLLENLRSMTDRTLLIITHREAVLDFCNKRIHFEKPDGK